MTVKQTAMLGSVIGLITSSAVMVLLWFGVSGVLGFRGYDLMYLVWPSAVMLVGGWRSTLPGIIISAYSVAINCLMYAAVALLLRACIRSINRVPAANAMPERTRSIVIGVVVALIAAFAYSLVVCVLMANLEAVPIKLAAYFVLLALWFVLPLGALLGAYLPRSLARLSRGAGMGKGFRWGAIAGIGCGILWAIQLSVMFRDFTMIRSAVSFGVTMGIYSGCCVSLTALKYSNKY